MKPVKIVITLDIQILINLKIIFFKQVKNIVKINKLNSFKNTHLVEGLMHKLQKGVKASNKEEIDKVLLLLKR